MGESQRWTLKHVFRFFRSTSDVPQRASRLSPFSQASLSVLRLFSLVGSGKKFIPVMAADDAGAKAGAFMRWKLYRNRQSYLNSFDGFFMRRQI